MSYKHEYHIYVVCKASQIVTLNHEEEALSYHEVDEIYDNEHYQIYDITDNVPVGHIDAEPDDYEMFRSINKMIKEYETNLK